MSPTSTDDLPVDGSATVRLDVAPDVVFAALTDLDVLPTLSPENERCELLEGSDAVEVGARFRGWNRSGDHEWHADCVVTELEPGRRFAYEVPPGFEHATTWSYEIEPDGDGSVVTESFHAPMLALPDVYPGRIEGRCENLRRACETTLANLRAHLES
ncbi:SRPBCC family protein [Ilumatobacter sp.]|uniref:SRPBCC family protein n=1 Tax=Ilumatobacter sp. TaxID=1967498 RepID=UPI003B51B3F4